MQGDYLVCFSNLHSLNLPHNFNSKVKAIVG